MNKSVLGLVVGSLLAGGAFAAEHPEHPKATAPAAGLPAIAPGATAGASAESAGKLDGKVFAGEIGKKGEAKGDKDEFVFKQGKFVSTACIAYGFNEAPYVATEKDGTISFTSEPKNAKAEKMSWKGAVTNSVLEGTALYQKEASQIEYWFKGALKPKAAQSEGSSTKSEHPEHPKKSEHPEHPK